MMERLLVVATLLLAAGCWAQDEVLGPVPTSHAGSPPSDASSQPLVRCPRPLCRMFCQFGMQIGEDGCPICSCKPHPCEEVKCPMGQKCEVPPCEGLGCMDIEGQCVPAKHVCLMHKCVPCPSGHYFKDQYGCQTCQCMKVAPGEVGTGPEIACAMPMCSDRCPHGYQFNADGCMTCDCKPPSSELPPGLVDPISCPPGPMERCSKACDNGYQKDERGCDMCECKRVIDGCAAIRCGYFMDCVIRKRDSCVVEPCLPEAMCVVPSLCELKKKMDGTESGAMMDFMESFMDMDKALGCSKDGSFEPKQCNNKGSQCWCVDDRGVAVPGSEWKVTEGVKSNRTCSSQKSSMAQLSFQLLHDMEDNDIQKAISDIKQWVRQFIRSMMGTKSSMIVRVEVDLIAPGVMAVEVDVVRQGSFDLPSAVHNLFRSCHEGYCHATFGNHKVETKPGSLQVKHRYEGVDEPVVDPPQIVHCFGYPIHLSKTSMILLPVAGFVLLTLIIVTVCVACNKKKSGSYQFSHKKLETMDSFKKNLVLSSEWEKPELLCKDQVSVTLTDTDDIKKVPLA